MITVRTERKILEKKRGGLVDKIFMGITHGLIGIEVQKIQKVKTIKGIPPPEKQSYTTMDFLENQEPYRFDSATYNEREGINTYLLPIKTKYVTVFDWKVFEKKGKNTTS